MEIIREIGAIHPCQIPVKNPAVLVSELAPSPGMQPMEININKMSRVHNTNNFPLFIKSPYFYSFPPLYYEESGCFLIFRIFHLTGYMKAEKEMFGFPVALNNASAIVREPAATQYDRHTSSIYMI